ncbi:MAG: class I SAM-dependent methyltransferase [Chitinophagaceae bacterium]|nr:MAG: class I SAM-dependent methyltransferase [Chitinophagaceae bacterium]
MSFLTKQNAYRFLTPVLGRVLPASATRTLVDKKLKENNIKYLDIGGAVPVEGYLVIHLSPVEVYGIPRKRSRGLAHHYDERGIKYKQEIIDFTAAVTLNYNLMEGIPVADNTFDGINMSHCLEHFTRSDGLAILKECRRVLNNANSTAVLRISCPDLAKYATAYVNQDDSYFNHPLVAGFVNYEGLRSYGDLFIHKAYDAHNGHKWFYDAESAIQLALDAGFKKGLIKKLHETSLPYPEVIEPAFREKESFYVEVYL